MKKLFNIFLLFLGFTLSFAQQYPVRIIPNLFQPYSLRLGDYATSTDNKLQLMVLMTDLMEPQHQTGLKFSLEAGLNAVPYAQSNDFVVGMQPFMLYPGSNLTLTNIDVRALFELQNLNGINALQYAQPLSDGVYRFCFQAYDFYTKRNLSDKSCATAFLVQYEPPMLNLPQRGEKVIKQGEFQNLVFQWMPRQIAPNTRYIFTLKELWDVERDPISGFLSSPPLWREETYAPTLFYGLDKTQLIAGKRYAWQVQAKSGNPVFDANPTDDNGVYKNNGLSEIFYFDYVENCAVPTLLMAKNAGRGRVELSWNLAGQPSGLYNVQYRKRGSTSEWQTAQSYQPRYIVTGLEDQTEYEYRIGSVCGNLQTFNNTNPITDGNSAGNAYAFSGIQFFTTDANSTNSNYQCGVMPAVDIANKNPLQSLLGANEVFTAGDFPVTVISAQGSNGIYSGTGFIVVPYLADTRVKVVFNNIKLNTDKKLIEGIIETTYDPTEKNVIGVGNILNDLGNLFDGIVKIIDDAIKGGGMSPKDYDDLSNNLGTYTSQSGSTVSTLYDQGLVSTELKDKIQAEKDKIDTLLKNLNCTKEEKGKGSNDDFRYEDECTEKLKELKTLLQNYQNFVNEAIANACVWNISPDENLKGKTFYFQKNVTDKVLHKLKAGDFPVSFNKFGNVYHFVSNGKIYKLFDGQDYYTDKDSKEKYAFESPETEINVSIDETVDDKITINGQTVTAGRDCSTDNKDKGNGLESGEQTLKKLNDIVTGKLKEKFPEKEVHFTVLDKKDPQYQQKLDEAQKQASYVIATIDQQGKVEIKSSFKVPEWFANALPDLGKQPEENCSNEYINVGLESLKNKDVYKIAPRSQQIAMEMGVIAYRGVFGTLYCMTDEKKFVNASPANQFVGGAMHEAIATFDVAQIVEGVVSLVKSGAEQQIMSPITYYNNLKEISTQGFDTNDDVKFAKQVMGVVLLPPSNTAIAQIEQGVKIAKQLKEHYFDCDKVCYYRYGQAAVIIVPIVLTVGEYAVAKLSTFARLSPELCNSLIKLNGKLAEKGVILEEQAGKTLIKNYDGTLVKTVESTDTEAIKNALEELIDIGSLQGKVKILSKETLFGNQASTFLNSEYTMVETLENIYTYRRFGGNAKLGGSYVSTVPNLSREELALVKEFNNSMRFEAVIKIPKGEKLAIGKVGPWPPKAPEFMGGADQIVINKYDYLENVWVESIKDFQTGTIYSYGEFCKKFNNLCGK